MGKYYISSQGFNVRLEARLKNAALINAREKLRLTGVKVAEGIGISQNYYNCIERLKSYPPKKLKKKSVNFIEIMEYLC